MTSLNKSFKMRLTKNNLSISCLIFCFLGFLDATYLTILHYKNAFPPCTLSGCEKVLTSSYSVVYGIPVSLLGSIFFAIALIVSLTLYLNRKKIFAKGLFVVSLTGLFVSAVLFFIQFLIIKSFCQYCLFSELMTLLFFASSSLLYSKYRK
jgi:uncharacterized membrane protein